MRWVVLLLIIPLIIGCAQKEKSVEIKSVFDNNGMIPKKYTCDGENISPPLFIENLSENAKSLVIIVEDPDANYFTHWVIYNIPPISEIPENIPKGKIIEKPFRAWQGKNDFGYYGYGGPCPPSGTHRYYFEVFVLDTVLEDKEYTKDELLSAMEGHVIQKGVLVGLYKRY